VTRAKTPPSGPPYEPYRSAEGLPPAAAALLAYIRTHDYVTFAEMPKVLAPFMETQGQVAAEAPQVPNLILWAGMSQAWVETLDALFAAHLIWQEPCSLTSYLIDGAMLTFPLAKRPPTGGYATPHWGPVCVRPIEHLRPTARTAPRGRAAQASRTAYGPSGPPGRTAGNNASWGSGG